MTFDQSEYDLRCEWGVVGHHFLAPAADALIIVDILVFSTAVDIAVANGASVLPYRWRDGSAAAFAASKGALLAGPRSAVGGYSLSPASLQSIPAGAALVLPSPNGSALATGAGAGAILAHLPGRPSPEAETAVAAFERFRHNLHDALARCISGRELIERGFPSDVELAAEYAVSSAAPILNDDRFVDCGPVVP